MNRGSTVGWDDLRGRTHASMRPRFMNRGSATVLDCHTSHLTKGFNEAPIHESGK